MNKNLTPIALFVYKRPEHTRRTIEALRNNILAPDSELHIFSDGAKNETDVDKVRQVREYLKTIDGFKKIVITERAENWGLSKSIIAGVTEMLGVYSKTIVMEDDLVTSPFFLEYMNDGLSTYEKDDRVASIHGYVFPTKKPLPETYFLRGADCWGWATWKRAWDLFETDGKKLLTALETQNLTGEFDMDGAYSFTAMLKRQIAEENDSWAIRWHASMFLLGKLTLYPGASLVNNIGQDRSGTHGNDARVFETSVSLKPIKVGPITVEENRAARKIMADYLHSCRPNFFARILIKLRSLSLLK